MKLQLCFIPLYPLTIFWFSLLSIKAVFGRHLAVLDDNDGLIALYEIPNTYGRFESDASIDDLMFSCPNEQQYVTATNTPNVIVNALNYTFEIDGTYSDLGVIETFINTTMWRKYPKLSNDCKTFIGFCITERNPSSIQNPCDLAPGTYTWTMTQDFQLTFGKIANKLEFGTKHIALANQRGVYSAGELYIVFDDLISNLNTKYFYWNIDSGSFVTRNAMYQGNTQLQALLQNATSKIWNVINCSDNEFNANFKFVNYSLTSIISYANSSYINNLCEENVRLFNISDWSYIWTDENTTDTNDLYDEISPCQDNGAFCFDQTEFETTQNQNNGNVPCQNLLKWNINVLISLFCLNLLSLCVQM